MGTSSAKLRLCLIGLVWWIIPMRMPPSLFSQGTLRINIKRIKIELSGATDYKSCLTLPYQHPKAELDLPEHP